ncbi:MAG TPA: TetR/AcrR family transcriptional regulator [Candidatus Phocaeicola gallistercoris]|nr:TetR/AcrR family transcriptional regulator [Candidatus Phocaeicola gallistercoris]
MDKELNYSQDTETRILQAAEKEFFEKGYIGARTTSIAEAAGVTHTMLHYYFRTKDKLFEQIVSKKINMLGDIILSAIGDNNLPLEDRIRQGVERHFDFISANRDLPRFIVNEVFSHPERIEILKTSIQNIVNDLLNNLQQEIDEYAAKGLCQQADARMLLIDIVSLNVFPFMAAPIVKEAIGYSYKSYDEFLTLRKKENVETVLRKLKIH